MVGCRRFSFLPLASALCQRGYASVVTLYSSNLNLIKHAWAKLKEIIYQLDPDIENYQGSIRDLKDWFNNLIKHAWEGLGQEYFNKLIKSMLQRIQAVIKVKGWYTKY
jgi:hypothetical protein